jgi:hypothetical protein
VPPDPPGTDEAWVARVERGMGRIGTRGGQGRGWGRARRAGAGRQCWRRGGCGQRRSWGRARRMWIGGATDRAQAWARDGGGLGEACGDGA